MGLLSRIFGAEAGAPRRSRGAPGATDEASALERYRYMLQTAPPETIEQAHAEAFEKLTPEQRRQVLAELAHAAPAHERRSLQQLSSDDSRALARAATRAELRQPGVMQRMLGGSGVGGAGLGMGASLLGSFAAAFAGSMVASSFFSALGGLGDHHIGAGSDADAADTQAAGYDAAEDDADPAGLGDFDGADVGDAGDFDGADLDF